MENCNKCKKEKNHCGCTKIDAKCVVYKGECLENLDFCSPKDVEEIIKIIDSIIGEIYLSIDKFFVGLNVGLGAEVYKGKSPLGFEEFKTLTSNISINITEAENTLNFSIDEDWLTDFITNIVSQYTTNIASQDGSIIVDNTSDPKNIEINPIIFNSTNNSININSTTTGGGQRRINFNVDEGFIEDIVLSLLPPPPVIPTISNVGTGADVYKGLNGTINEFRGITTNITQPTNPGLLSGTITSSATVNGDNINVNIDFSNLSATPQTFGVPEYYVNSANPNTGDGSSVNPFKTWSACKAAIGGTPNTNRNVKVIFQSTISSPEDLTLNGVNYVFQNSATFIYTGATGSVIDYSKFTDTTPNSYKQIILSGNGTIEQETHLTRTLTSFNIIGGDGTYSRILRIEGNITVVERNRIADPSTNSSFVLVDRRNGVGGLVYGYNEPFVKGTIDISGSNHAGTSLLYIAPNYSLTIKDRINPTIHLSSGGIGLSEGTRGMIVAGTLSLLHEGEYYRYSTIGGSSPNTYLNYSTNIPRLWIEDGYGIGFNNGVFRATHTGSSNSGGYSSLIKMTGESSLDVSRDSRFVVDLDLYYRYIFEVSTGTVIRIDNINTSNFGYNNSDNFLQNFFYSPTSAIPSLNLHFGKVQWDGSGTFKNVNITTVPYTNWVFVNGTPVSSSMATTASASLNNDIYTNTGVLTRD